MVIAWTAFPVAFASTAATLYIPLTLVAIGIIFRGSAFVFRESVPNRTVQELFGVAFAASSLLTPFFLGAAAGAIAGGRIPYGGVGEIWSSWLNPTALTSGLLAVLICAYLAAVYLTGEARRTGSEELAEYFRTRALATGAVTGVAALAALAVIWRDAEQLLLGLLDAALPIAAASVLAGTISLALLVARRYGLVRLTAAAAVTLLLVAWAAAQYPYILEPGTTIDEAAASHSVLVAVLISLAVGAALLVPSLIWLYVLFQREAQPTPGSAASQS